MNARPLASMSVPTPLGTITLVASPHGLTQVLFPGERGERPAPHDEDPSCRAHLDEGSRQLREYFAGRRRSFDVTLDPTGTEFDQQVWSALREIPFGATMSYGELARRLGKPGAARAVGHANGRNPLAIVVPCHRVIAADGTLGGYAGGLDLKRRLLALEGVTPAARTSS